MSSGNFPHTGNHPTDGDITLAGMDDNHPRAVLAANLARLMQHGKEQRKLRRRGGPATAVELESKAGIGDSTISRYRHNAAAANLDDLYKIALAYDLQVWELLYPDLNPAAPPATQRAALGVNDVLKAAHDLYMRQGGIDGGGFKTGGAAGADTHRVAPGKHPARKGR